MNKTEKQASVYQSDEIMIQNPNDISRGNRGVEGLFLDTIHRDLNSPSIEDLAKFFGFDMEEITEELD